MDQITGLEVELAVTGLSIPRLLAALRAGARRAVEFDGKGGGWLQPLAWPGHDEAWVKVTADGPHDGDLFVLELATTECCGLGAADQLVHAIWPFLIEVQEALGVTLQFGAGLPHRRLGFHHSVALPTEGTAFYPALRALLSVLHTQLVPLGGWSPTGYVPAPRLATHTQQYFGRDPDLPRTPLAYHRYRMYGGGRAHLALEYPRSPHAIALTCGLVALFGLAWRRQPARLDVHPLVFMDAARRFNRFREPAPVFVNDATDIVREVTAPALCRELLGRAEDALGADLPPWGRAVLETAHLVLDDQRADRVRSESAVYCDWLLKRDLIATILAEAGLEFPSPEADAAIGTLSGLLLAGVDLDELFPSAGVTTRSVVAAPAAWGFTRSELGRLGELYWSGLRAALLFEAEWRRLGDSPCDRLLAQLGVGPCPLLRREFGDLAPRAVARQPLLELGAGWGRATWDEVHLGASGSWVLPYPWSSSPEAATPARPAEPRRR